MDTDFNGCMDFIIATLLKMVYYGSIFLPDF